eukprot:scaffold6583_cov82-Cyclotella_meneghiniana.AAC.3
MELRQNLAMPDEGSHIAAPPCRATVVGTIREGLRKNRIPIPTLSLPYYYFLFLRPESSVEPHDADVSTDYLRHRRYTILVTIQHQCAQHVDVSGYYRANSHPLATGSSLVSRMIVSSDIVLAAGGDTSYR